MGRGGTTNRKVEINHTVNVPCYIVPPCCQFINKNDNCEGPKLLCKMCSTLTSSNRASCRKHWLKHNIKVILKHNPEIQTLTLFGGHISFLLVSPKAQVLLLFLYPLFSLKHEEVKFPLLCLLSFIELLHINHLPFLTNLISFINLLIHVYDTT